MSLIGTLEISRKALNAFKTALTVTGHNIANVNTPGYSRQRVELSPSIPLDELPSGVDVEGIRRVRDLFADLKYREAIAEQGRWDVQRGVFEKVESVIGDTGEGSLLDLLDRFWAAWHDLANLPESTSSRIHLIQTAQALTAKLKEIDSHLVETLGSIDEMLEEKLLRSSELLREVAELNVEIAAVMGGGGNTSDLQDKRDAALDELSKLMGIGYSFEENGAVDLRAGGVTLVQSGEYSSLHLERTSSDVAILTQDGVEVEPGGELGGLIELRGKVSALLGEIRRIGAELITRVNELHSSGYGLDGSTGTPFFTGNDSSDIEVNSDLIDNPALIAAASEPDSPGDNSLALSIVSLRDTFDSEVKSLLTEVGSMAAQVERMAEGSKAVAERINSLREGFSGVSLEEELLDLVIYQRAFQAASKVAAVIDDLLQTVLNMV